MNHQSEHSDRHPTFQGPVLAAIFIFRNQPSFFGLAASPRVQLVASHTQIYPSPAPGQPGATSGYSNGLPYGNQHINVPIQNLHATSRAPAIPQEDEDEALYWNTTHSRILKWRTSFRPSKRWNSVPPLVSSHQEREDTVSGSGNSTVGTTSNARYPFTTSGNLSHE